jgi:putative pyoverdin transport system ATP-binding/permease protein
MFEAARIIRYILLVSRNLKVSRLKVIAAIGTGLLSGVGYTLMIATINSALSNGPSRRLLLVFVGLCLVVPLNRLISQALLNSISAKAILEMRLQLCRRILSTDLRTLERIGPHRLTACLTDDVTAISNALVQIPALCMHVAIILAALVYMSWLSTSILLVVILVLAVGLLSYSIPVRKARFYFERMREELDTLFAHFRGLIHGSKELKLHRRRRESFLVEELYPSAESIRHSTFMGNTIFTAAAVWGNLLFFVAIGILVFVLARGGGLDTKVLAGYTLALLYIVTPLEVIFQALPVLGRASAATRKLEKLGIELASEHVEMEAPVREPSASWKRLELAGIQYTYRSDTSEADESFTLGPISLAFEPGEIVFVIGGNGSGKSTLAKIIAGLYTPESGEIRLDGFAITDRNRDNYRQAFSAVFSDFYLFQNFLGLDDSVVAQEAQSYLSRLHLTSKVKVREGKLSTLDLSQGQRKRLALLVAYLEDRPIYFFDEWAADQDPQYKATFYRELLPELKARGKTVFVITHDDQYYEFGDRLIKLNYGQVEWDRPANTAARPAEVSAQS